MIQIPKRSSTCSIGLEPFEPGVVYFSLLKENEKSEVERKDFCSACWENTHEKHAQSIKYWKSKVVKKNVNAPPPTKNAQILQMLKSSIELEENVEESFVLALYLARMKVLILRKEMRDKDSILQVYEVAQTEEILVVKKIEISKLKTHEIQTKIALALSNRNE